MLNRPLLFGAAAMVLVAVGSGWAAAETRTGTSARDVLTGNPGQSTLKGGGGNDVLYGEPVAGMGKPRKMQRLSVTKAGKQGFGKSFDPVVSADGRTMLFISNAPQFFPAGTANGVQQVFSKDLATGAVKLITKGTAGEPGNGDTYQVAISPNGKFAAFSTRATNLLDQPIASSHSQMVLKNLHTGKYSLLSKSPGGVQGDFNSDRPTFNSASTLVAFESLAGNLDPADTNMFYDVFVAKVGSPNVLYRASTQADGGLATGGHSLAPVFSPDGRTLAFSSQSDNLSGNDANGTGFDVFLKTLSTLDETNRVVIGDVELISTDGSGVADSIGDSWYSAFSPDGREVAFTSSAQNLVPGDTTPYVFDDGNMRGGDIYIKTIKDGGLRSKGEIRRVSLSTGGVQGDGVFDVPRFSPDGTKLAFVTNAVNLAPGATNGLQQVMIKDLTDADGLGKVTLVSRGAGSAGEQGDDTSFGTTFVGHGSQLVFTSRATNLIANDGNGNVDIFLATLAAPAAGNDAILGGPGKDVIVGGRGADRLTGGKGADRFVYLSTADSRPKRSKRDTILDFKVSQGDKIDLTAIDANTKKKGRQAFTFIGARPFDGKPGRLRFSNGILSADTTGNRKPNFAVRIHATGKITAKSFVRP